jgi:hypothetical protein
MEVGRMATEEEPEPNWKLMAKRAEDVLGDLEAAATAALAQSRYRPGVTALAVEVARLRTAIDNAVSRQIAVNAIYDAAYQLGRQAPRLPVQSPRARRHLTLINEQDQLSSATDQDQTE